MSKIAIMTDSNSGITQSAAKQLGLYVLPMPFSINGKDYLEDIELSIEDFYKYLLEDADFATSQPSIGDVKNFYDRLLREYDEIIHIPCSSGLSGTCDTAMMIAQEEPYKGKVHVVDSRRISVIEKHDALSAVELVKQGKSAQEIVDLLTKTRSDCTIYITVDTLHYLEKGGRLTPSAAAMGKLLKIKPILTIQGDKLDSFKKTRTLAKGKEIMLESAINDINERIDPEGKGDNCEIYVAYSYNSKLGDEFVDEIKKVFPDHNITSNPLSLSICIHTGPNAIAIAVAKKIV